MCSAPSRRPYFALDTDTFALPRDFKRADPEPKALEQTAASSRPGRTGTRRPPRYAPPATRQLEAVSASHLPSRLGDIDSTLQVIDVAGTAEYVDTEGIKRTAVLVAISTVLKDGEQQRAVAGAMGQR